MEWFIRLETQCTKFTITHPNNATFKWIWNIYCDGTVPFSHRTFHSVHLVRQFYLIGIWLKLVNFSYGVFGYTICISHLYIALYTSAIKVFSSLHRHQMSSCFSCKSSGGMLCSLCYSTLCTHGLKSSISVTCMKRAKISKKCLKTFQSYNILSLKILVLIYSSNRLNGLIIVIPSCYRFNKSPQINQNSTV